MFIHQILCRYLERVLATFIGQLISQEIIDARSFLLPIIMQMWNGQCFWICPEKSIAW